MLGGLMPAPPLPEDILRETVEARIKYGSEAAAAHALGMSRSTFQTRLRIAASRGIAPGHFDQGTAPGFAMGKVTVQRGPSHTTAPLVRWAGSWSAQR